MKCSFLNEKWCLEYSSNRDKALGLQVRLLTLHLPTKVFTVFSMRFSLCLALKSDICRQYTPFLAFLEGRYHAFNTEILFFANF